jgi:hypothetical protein
MSECMLRYRTSMNTHVFTDTSLFLLLQSTSPGPMPSRRHPEAGPEQRQRPSTGRSESPSPLIASMVNVRASAQGGRGQGPVSFGFSPKVIKSQARTLQLEMEVAAMEERLRMARGTLV